MVCKLILKHFNIRERPHMWVNPTVARISDAFLEQVRSLAFHQLPVKHSVEDLLVTYSIRPNLNGGQIATDGLACFKLGDGLAVTRPSYLTDASN